jgi:DNA-binding NarL/FixJ family response regulator
MDDYGLFSRTDFLPPPQTISAVPKGPASSVSVQISQGSYAAAVAENMYKQGANFLLRAGDEPGTLRMDIPNTKEGALLQIAVENSNPDFPTAVRTPVGASDRYKWELNVALAKSGFDIIQNLAEGAHVLKPTNIYNGVNSLFGRGLRPTEAGKSIPASNAIVDVRTEVEPDMPSDDLTRFGSDPNALGQKDQNLNVLSLRPSGARGIAPSDTVGLITNPKTNKYSAQFLPDAPPTQIAGANSYGQGRRAHPSFRLPAQPFAVPQDTFAKLLNAFGSQQRSHTFTSSKTPEQFKNPKGTSQPFVVQSSRSMDDGASSTRPTPETAQSTVQFAINTNPVLQQALHDNKIDWNASSDFRLKLLKTGMIVGMTNPNQDDSKSSRGPASDRNETTASGKFQIKQEMPTGVPPPSMSEGQRRVFELYARGGNNATIGYELGLKPETVALQISMLRKSIESFTGTKPQGRIELLDAVRTYGLAEVDSEQIARARLGMTANQQEILTLLAQSKSYEEVAFQLGTTPRSVAVQVKQLGESISRYFGETVRTGLPGLLVAADKHGLVVVTESRLEKARNALHTGRRQLSDGGLFTGSQKIILTGLVRGQSYADIARTLSVETGRSVTASSVKANVTHLRNKLSTLLDKPIESGRAGLVKEIVENSLLD